jgi:hypothetical protein
MELSDKTIKEFQDLYKEKYGAELSRGEAEESARNLIGLVEILWECYKKDKARERKLEEFPKGFPLDADGHTCFICGNSMPKEQSWFDKWGMKCLTCQKAVDQKIIPGSAAKNKDSWYSIYDLESRFNLKSQTVTKFIRQGILKARVIPGPSGRPHAKIFLIKDNKDTLPPKKLTETQVANVKREGAKTSFNIEPWYKFVDPHVRLKGYKIMDHLQVTHEKKDGN